MSRTREINFVCNRTKHSIEVAPRKLLSDVLREDLQLTGTNVGCEHGVCGACSVLVNGELVRSCLTLAVQADGVEIITIEGLADGEQLHPLQQAFYEKYGAQCGFCTPGQVMTAYALLSENPEPTEEEVRETVSGVLCRCTGYYHIIESVKLGAERMREEAALEPGS